MSMTQDFIDMLIGYESSSYINEISEEEFKAITKNKEPMKICDYDQWQEIKCMKKTPHPLLKIYNIEEWCDWQYHESWFYRIAFKYKGKYYEYIEEG